jgi:multiple sugar transport system permease protein
VSGLGSTLADPAAAATPAAAVGPPRKRSYWAFILPAVLIVGAIILFPWVFTLWMSVNEWKVGESRHFVGLANYLRLAGDARFMDALWHTLVYTALSVAAPIVFGTIAALIFNAFRRWSWSRPGNGRRSSC